MKITVISSTVFSLPLQGYGGLEIIAWQQAAGLAAKGHTVTLIAPDGSTCPGANVIHIGPERQVDEKQAFDKYWPRLMDQDVIVDHSWHKFPTLLRIEGTLRVPSLLWTHAPVHSMFQTPPALDKPCFVAISKDQARYCLGLLQRRALVCYNGVDTTFYKPLDLPRTDRYLFLARFSTVKSPDIACRACLKAGVGLDLVGDMELTQEPELYQQCRRMADGEQIRLIGPCSRGEAVYWFSQAKALLHPNNRFIEPFGLAPVEAQLCGAPVLAWRNGAMEETVAHGKSGFLVDTEDELVDLLKQNAVADLDRDYCRQWASQFSMENMVNRVEELCQLAVKTGGW